MKYQLLTKDQCEYAPLNRWATATPAETSSVWTSLNGLLPYSLYNVSVAAYNTAGPGQSVYVTGTTESDGKYTSNNLKWKCILVIATTKTLSFYIAKYM